MADTVPKELTSELLDALQQERLILLGTIDHESKAPSVNAISWVYAMDTNTIRFAIDNRSRILRNLQAEPKVSLTFIAEESAYSVVGEAKVVEEVMEGVPLKLAKVEIAISAVHHVMFYGSRIVQEPLYEKTYNPEAAKKLDNQVFTALKKA